MKAWHKLTPFFTQNMLERIAVVNNSWTHYPLVQRIEAGAFSFVQKNVPSVENLYMNFPSNITNKISKIYEENHPTNFQPLREKNVNVHKYQKGEQLDTQQQAEPDNVFDFRQSQFIDQRVHGMDSKAYENPREFESRIFSNFSREKFEGGLNAMRNLIISNIDIHPELFTKVDNALTLLAESCENVAKHQIIWAQYLHLFPNEFVPPMRVPHNFSIQDLHPHVLSELQKSTLRMQLISDKLYEQKVPENDYKRAAELLEGSFLQDLLK